MNDSHRRLINSPIWCQSLLCNFYLQRTQCQSTWPVQILPNIYRNMCPCRDLVMEREFGTSAPCGKCRWGGDESQVYILLTHHVRIIAVFFLLSDTPLKMSILSTTGEADISCGRITDWIMAQTNSGGQGTNGVADESPNMIVYRKVRQLLFLAGTCFASLRVCNSPCTSRSMTGRAVEITDGKDGRLEAGDATQYQLSESAMGTRRCFSVESVRHTYKHLHINYWLISSKMFEE